MYANIPNTPNITSLILFPKLPITLKLLKNNRSVITKAIITFISSLVVKSSFFFKFCFPFERELPAEYFFLPEPAFFLLFVLLFGAVFLLCLLNYMKYAIIATIPAAKQ